jgi:hypothetical protein
VVLNGEAFGCKLTQITRTVVYVKYTLARIALEVVVVRMLGGLIAGAIAWYVNNCDLSFVKQAFQIAIDGGLTQARHLRFRGIQHFLRR